MILFLQLEERLRLEREELERKQEEERENEQREQAQEVSYNQEKLKGEINHKAILLSHMNFCICCAPESVNNFLQCALPSSCELTSHASLRLF